MVSPLSAAAAVFVPATARPAQLPNGLWITLCAAHQRNVCRDCGRDFSRDLSTDGDYLSDDEEGEGLFGRDPVDRKPRNVAFPDLARSRWGTRRHAARARPHGAALPVLRSAVYGEPFSHEGVFLWHPGKEKTRERGLRPQDLYPPGPAVPAGEEGRHAGFRHRVMTSQMLIYTDGACSDNGRPDARGGCGFVFNGTAHGRVSFRLEDVGPDGNGRPQTSNRAELRATIAALRFRLWWHEGVDTIVIATDSVYVAEGAMKWVRTWRCRDWIDRKHDPTKNRDLWLLLLEALETLRFCGIKVKFWKIPRSWNQEADKAAKDAVELKAVGKFMDIFAI